MLLTNRIHLTASKFVILHQSECMLKASPLEYIQAFLSLSSHMESHAWLIEACEQTGLPEIV